MSRTVKPTGSRRPEFRALEERLWWSRETAHLTQQEMADLLGVSRKTVQNYEAGVGYPKENRLVLWANAADADYEWLAGDFYGAPSGRPPSARITETSDGGSSASNGGCVTTKGRRHAPRVTCLAAAA